MGYLKQKILLEKDMTEIKKRANPLADEAEASRNSDLFIKSKEFRKILNENEVDLKKLVNKISNLKKQLDS